jgi:hypothetical protein
VCLARAGEKFSRAIIIDVESEASVEETFDVVRILRATFLSFPSGLASEGKPRKKKKKKNLFVKIGRFPRKDKRKN